MRQNKKILTLCKVGLFTALLCLSAWLYLPLAVPITMQSFILFCMLGILKPKTSLLTLLVYLTLGTLGLPVFGGFQGGIGVILGPGGGFLLGFIPCSVLCALLYQKSEKIVYRIVISVVGTVVLYLCGTLWYTLTYGNGNAFLICILPFLVPDMIKILLAVTVSKKLRKILK